MHKNHLVLAAAWNDLFDGLKSVRTLAQHVTLRLRPPPGLAGSVYLLDETATTRKPRSLLATSFGSGFQDLRYAGRQANAELK